jgi:hypothetical protein
MAALDRPEPRPEALLPAVPVRRDWRRVLAFLLQARGDRSPG